METKKMVVAAGLVAALVLGLVLWPSLTHAAQFAGKGPSARLSVGDRLVIESLRGKAFVKQANGDRLELDASMRLVALVEAVGIRGAKLRIEEGTLMIGEKTYEVIEGRGGFLRPGGFVLIIGKVKGPDGETAKLGLRGLLFRSAEGPKAGLIGGIRDEEVGIGLRLLVAISKQ